MKDIVLTKNEINNLKLLKDDSYGAYGKIVKYNDGVLKIYHHKINEFLLEKLKKNIKRKSNIIIYPDCFVYENYICDEFNILDANGEVLLNKKLDNYNEADVKDKAVLEILKGVKGVFPVVAKDPNAGTVKIPKVEPKAVKPLKKVEEATE